MEPREMSGVVWVGRTIDWPNLREFRKVLNGVHVQTDILVQKLVLLVALKW
jgi:hypothetical protein